MDARGTPRFARLLALGAAALAGLVFAAPSMATPVTFSEIVNQTDFAQAGIAGVGDSASVNIMLSGVSGTVKKAYLYYHGIGNPAYAPAGVTFAGVPVVPVSLGNATTNCWGAGSSTAYRANVTAQVTGNGTYAVANLANGAGMNANGASLIVFFDDGNAANNRDVALFEGNDSDHAAGFPGETDGWHSTLSNIVYTTGTANAYLHAADGQAASDGNVVFKATPNNGGTNPLTIFDTAALWEGVSLPDAGRSRLELQGGQGDLYDIHGFDITGLFNSTPGTYTVNLDQNHASDCLGLILLVLDFKAGALVQPDPPISATGKSISATEGAPFSGVVASFTDPDMAATAAEYSATINWGDGTPLSTGTVSGPTGGPFNVSGSHTYLEEGSYTITVVITDVDTPSNTATATSQATVADAALTGTCTDSTSLTVFNGVVQTFSDADPNGAVADYSATINWGDASSSPGTIAPSGAQFTVSGTHVYAATGSYTITVTTSDVGGSKTTTACKVLVASFAAGGGSFVIGDLNSAVGTNVTFWGAQWWKLNFLSGGAAPAAFKGFANDPATPSCGSGWSTAPGNSPPPPAGPLPAFMAVIVSSSISKSGSTISGNTPHIVIVQTNPGYDANPGHAGTGAVVATLC